MTCATRAGAVVLDFIDIAEDVNAVDDQLRHPDDGERIGLILCTTHNQTVAKLALHRSGAPIAVAGQGGDRHPSRPEATIA
jgi:hypothetical protein